MTDQTRAEIGRRLLNLRRERGVAQRELAAAVGVDPSMISRVEKGQRELSGTQLSAAARFLGAAPETLIPQGDGVAGAISPLLDGDPNPQFRDDMWRLASMARGEGAKAVEVLAIALIKALTDARSASQLDDADAEGPTGQAVRLPPDAHWDVVIEAAQADDPLAGLAHASAALERANPHALQGAFPRFDDPGRTHIYVRLIAATSAISFGSDANEAGVGYALLIDAMAASEGVRGGGLVTPWSLVQLVTALVPARGSVIFDPACGAAGFLAAAATAARARRTVVRALGQEIAHDARAIGRMNLAAHDVDADLRAGDSLLEDRFGDLQADVVYANPPFRQRAWGAGQVVNDLRWRYVSPSDNDATVAWVQHVLHHLADEGEAALILGAGALRGQRYDERELRRGLVTEARLLGVVACPAGLFTNTSIQSCIWILGRGEGRAGVLLIDASGLGQRRARGRVELARRDIDRVAATYSRWRTHGTAPRESGFATVVTPEDIALHDFDLTPKRYIAMTQTAVDPEDLDDHITRLTDLVEKDFAEATRLQAIISDLMARERR